jgi:hypothetical protein
LPSPAGKLSGSSLTEGKTQSFHRFQSTFLKNDWNRFGEWIQNLSNAFFEWTGLFCTKNDLMYFMNRQNLLNE